MSKPKKISEAWADIGYIQPPEPERTLNKDEAHTEFSKIHDLIDQGEKASE